MAGACAGGRPRRPRRLASTSATQHNSIRPKAPSAPSSASGARIASSAALRSSIAAVASRMPRNAVPCSAPADWRTREAISITVKLLLTSPPRKPDSSAPRVPYIFQRM